MNETTDTADKPSKPLSTDTMRITVTADMIKELSNAAPKDPPKAVAPQAIEGSHAGLQSSVAHVTGASALAIPPATANPTTPIAAHTPAAATPQQPQLIVNKKKSDVAFIVAVIGAVVIIAGVCVFLLTADKSDTSEKTEVLFSEGPFKSE